jgi:hypothetical protein
MLEEIKFPPNICRLINRRRGLSKIRSIEAEIKAQDEISNIDEQIRKIKLFYFDPYIDLDTPKKILEMAGLFAENETEKIKYCEQLKNTGFEDDFNKTDGDHLEDDLKDILAIRRGVSQYRKFREIIENPILSMAAKLKKLSTFIKSHEKMIMDNMRINEKHMEKLSEAGLDIADYMLIESYSNWGFPSPLLLYIAGIRTKDDILTATPEKLLEVKGFGKQSLDEFYSFVETIKNMNNFNVDVWAFNDVDYSYKANFDFGFFNSIENTLLAYTSFGDTRHRTSVEKKRAISETQRQEKRVVRGIENTPKENRVKTQEAPFDISKARKRRKGFWIAAIVFGILGLLSIPIVIWAIIYLAISGFLFLAWKGANDMIKKAETT